VKLKTSCRIILAVSSLKETNDYQMYMLKVQNWAVYKRLFSYLLLFHSVERKAIPETLSGVCLHLYVYILFNLFQELLNLF
jgi:hypothetical protein